jgi:hypothetical protein
VLDQVPMQLRTDQFLCLDRHFGESFNTRPILPQSVLHDAEVDPVAADKFVAGLVLCE